MVIPTGAFGVLLFVVLLLPGFLYRRLRDEAEPDDRPKTQLRETVSIVSASLVALAVVFLVFAVLRIVFPAETPDVGQLLFHPQRYLEKHYAMVAWWGIGLFV